jgi:hypothetical protein
MTNQSSILSSKISFNFRNDKLAITAFQSVRVNESDDQHEQSRETSRHACDKTLTNEKSDVTSLETIKWIAGVGDICNGASREEFDRASTTEDRKWKGADSSQRDLTAPVKPYNFQHNPKSKRSALQRHCDFWDADHNGLIYPWDIFMGFSKLGFNIALCLWAAVTMALCSSYSTQGNWLPHPLFAINVNNIHRSRHGSTTAAYDMDAELDMRRFDAIFQKYAEDNDYLTWRTMYNVWAGQCCANDFFGWFAGGLECKDLVNDPQL